jgi:hypothetical protein
LLCRGIVLKRLIELKHTVDLFLETVIPLSRHFEGDDTRNCWLAYRTDIQGGSNMTGTDLCVNKPHKSRSYLNHLVFSKLDDLNIQSDGKN